MISTNPFALTHNEIRAAFILVSSCLAGMGGNRPGNLEDDEYTWIDIQDLMAKGYSRHEAAGTFSSLDSKGVISEYDKNEWILNTKAWQWLDTVWDERSNFEA